jgi:hypothetical protein
MYLLYLVDVYGCGGLDHETTRHDFHLVLGRKKERIMPCTCPFDGIPHAPIQADDNGTISSLEYTNLHVQNQDLIDAVPVGFTITCLLKHMNTQEDFRDDTLYLYVEELFRGCIFQRGRKPTMSLSKIIIGRIRHTVTNRIGPTNTEIIQYMQEVWINGHYEDTVDTLFRPRAKAVRRTRRSTDNLLHVCLYIILTQLHRSNVKRDLFKPPEDFPVFLSPSVRGRLSCLSRYLESTMYTMFPNGMISAVSGAVSTHTICTNDDVVCSPIPTVDHMTYPQLLKCKMSPFVYLEHMQHAEDEAYRKRSNRQSTLGVTCTNNM